jgi:hypothetical protein
MRIDPRKLFAAGIVGKPYVLAPPPVLAIVGSVHAMAPKIGAKARP